jgi:hypothetical protein
MNLKTSDLAVGHPTHSGCLAIGVGPDGSGLLAIRKACAGAFQGEPKHNVSPFHGSIVPIENVDDKRSHYLAVQFIHFPIARKSNYPQAFHHGQRRHGFGCDGLLDAGGLLRTKVRRQSKNYTQDMRQPAPDLQTDFHCYEYILMSYPTLDGHIISEGAL